MQVDDPTFKPVCLWALGYAGFRLGVGALEVTRSGPQVRSHTLASPLPDMAPGVAGGGPQLSRRGRLPLPRPWCVLSSC